MAEASGVVELIEPRTTDVDRGGSAVPARLLGGVTGQGFGVVAPHRCRFVGTAPLTAVRRARAQVHAVTA